MHKLSLSALVSNTLNRQITNVRIVSLAPALIDWRSPATQSTQYNTISKVLIKSFSPGEEFLDYENSEYCRLPKNFEFMIIVFCVMYDNIMINLGSVAFKLWIIVYTLKVLSIELHLVGIL